MASRGRAPLARFLFSPSAPAVVPSVVSPASPGLCNDSTNVELPQVTTRTNTPLVVTSPLSTTDANSQPRPNEDIMDEDANVGVEEAEIVSTPTPNGSSAVGNSCHNVEKIFVGVDGNNVYDFKPWDEAHLKMSEIVRSHYTGAWSSITKVPLATKDMWFEEFKEKFESLVVTQDDEIDSGEVMTDLEEKRLWLTACGGQKNKKIFALGEQGAALIRSGTFSTSPSQSHHNPEFQEAFVQPFKDEIQELKATVVNLLKQQEEQQQKQAEFQLLILQQLTRLQGNSN